MRFFLFCVGLSLILHLIFFPEVLGALLNRPAAEASEYKRVEVTLVDSTPTPTPVPMPTPTPKPTPRPTPTPKPKPTPTPEPTPTPVPTPRPLPTPRPRATPVPPRAVKPPPVMFANKNASEDAKPFHMASPSASSPGRAGDVPTAGTGTGTPAPTPTPEPTPAPTPAPTPKPTPIAMHTPSGPPDREAIVASTVAPVIPSSLRSQNLKTYIRARFSIAADGSFEVELMNSSGNPQLDALTLQTLRQWRWQPAIQGGRPVASVQRVRVEFVVD